MFGFVRDDVASARRGTSRQTEHGEIARLGATARENDFVRFDLEQGAEFVARIINCRSGLTSGRMHARWISKMLLQIGQHRLPRCIAQRSCRVVIEVNHQLFLLLFVFLLLLLLILLVLVCKKRNCLIERSLGKLARRNPSISKPHWRLGARSPNRRAT